MQALKFPSRASLIFNLSVHLYYIPSQLPVRYEKHGEKSSSWIGFMGPSGSPEGRQTAYWFLSRLYQEWHYGPSTFRTPPSPLRSVPPSQHAQCIPPLSPPHVFPHISPSVCCICSFLFASPDVLCVYYIFISFFDLTQLNINLPSSPDGVLREDVCVYKSPVYLLSVLY